MKARGLCLIAAALAIAVCLSGCGSPIGFRLLETEGYGYAEEDGVYLAKSGEELEQILSAPPFAGYEENAIRPLGTDAPDYFSEKYVIAVYHLESSGSVKVSVEQVLRLSDTLRVKVKCVQPTGPGTCDMAPHYFFVEVDRAEAEGVASVELVLI